MPDEARRRLLGGRLRLELEPVLGREVVEQVRRAAGLDQVRREHRVVGRRERQVQRLRVVRDELGVAEQRGLRRLPGRDDDAVVATATAIRPSSIATPTRPRVAPSALLAPGDGLALELRPLLRGQRRRRARRRG